MSDGVPKPPPGFVVVQGSNAPPPPGFQAGPMPYAPVPGAMGLEELQRPVGTARRFARSVAEGATLGFSDEMQAFIASAIEQGVSYDDALQMARDRMARIPTGQRIAGNIFGGVASAPMMGLRAPAGAAQAFRQGTGLGALAGAGFAEGDLSERATGAAFGGALGGPLAVAGQQAVNLVGRAIARARQGVDRQTAKAMDRVLREMQANEITPQEAARQVRNLGPEGMLADVPELQRLAQQTASRTAAGQRIAQREIEARTRAGGARVTNALDEALSGRPLQEVRKGIAATRAADAQALYDPALSGGPLQRTAALESLIGRQTDKGVEGGSSLVRGQIASIRRSNPLFAEVSDTDPKLLHEVRVALGERSKGQGATKRNINSVVQQLTDAMDDAGAEGYRTAVDQYRSDSLTLDAFDQGLKALNQLPENIDQFLQSAAEKEAFTAGLARSVLQRLETGETGNAAQNVRSILRGERAEILRKTLGRETFNALRARLLRELAFAQTAGRTLGRSPTQPRQAAATESLQRMGRVARAGQAMREGRGLVSAGIEMASAAQPRGANIPQERALAQMMFQTQATQPQRFAGRTPLLELAMRDRLLRGAGAPVARGAIPGAAGVGAGQTGNALLNLVEF